MKKDSMLKRDVAQWLLRSNERCSECEAACLGELSAGELAKVMAVRTLRELALARAIDGRIAGMRDLERLCELVDVNWWLGDFVRTTAFSPERGPEWAADLREFVAAVHGELDGALMAGFLKGGE